MRNVYCDADVFLGWFNREQDKVEACRGLVDASEQGKVRIITSALTLTEVIKIKGQQPLPQSKEETIKGFFEQEFVSIVNLDRRTAEFARDLIWDYPRLNPKDSIWESLLCGFLLQIYLISFLFSFHNSHCSAPSPLGNARIRRKRLASLANIMICLRLGRAAARAFTLGTEPLAGMYSWPNLPLQPIRLNVLTRPVLLY